MGSTRTASIAAVKARHLDPSRNTGGTRLVDDMDVGRAVDRAVDTYGRHRPRTIVASVTGNGTHYYVVSTQLTSWVRGFSAITAVDYPAKAISANTQPYWLSDRDFEIYLDATDTEYLYLPVHAPASTETMRVHYTAPHTHTDATDTIFQEDLEAVRDLAAGVLCEMLATRASGSSDSTIAADSVNYRDKQLRYNQEAKAWREMYYRHLGLPIDGGVSAASVTWEWKTERASRQAYLFH